MFAQMPHTAPPQVVWVARKSGKALTSCQMIHGNTVGVWSTLIVETKLDAVLYANLRQLAHLVALAVDVAVTSVEWDGRTAASEVPRIAIVPLTTLADGFVHSANAVCVGAASGLATGPCTVLDSARVGKAAVTLRAVRVVEAFIEKRLAAPDSVVGVAQEGVAADARRQVLLAEAAGIWAADVTQADVHALVSTRLVAARFVFQAVLINDAVVGHLAARPVVDVSGKAFADGFVVLSQAVGVFATGLVFTNVTTLLDSLGTQLALKVFPAVVVLQTFVLGLG